MSDMTHRTDHARSTARALTRPRRSTIDDVDRLGAHVRPPLARQRLPPVLLPDPASRRRAALLRLADVDHDRRDALVALDGDEIVAVARYDGQRRRQRGRDRRHRRGRLAAPRRRQAPHPPARRAAPSTTAIELVRSPRCSPTTAPRSACSASSRPTRSVRFDDGEYAAVDAAAARELTRQRVVSRRRAVARSGGR